MQSKHALLVTNSNAITAQLQRWRAIAHELCNACFREAFIEKLPDQAPRFCCRHYRVITAGNIWCHGENLSFGPSADPSTPAVSNFMQNRIGNIRHVSDRTTPDASSRKF